MEVKDGSPMMVVDDVATNLRRLASLCNVMMFVDSSTCDVDADTVSDVMILLYECLEKQVKALNNVEWPSEGETV